MAARRGHGEGSIHRDGDRWLAWLELPATKVDAGGRPVRRRKKITGKNRKEVAAKLDAARRELGAGVVTDHRLTVATYLDRWLDRQELAGGHAAGTLTTYRDHLRYYVVPHIGGRRLAELTIGDVEQMTATIVASGKSPRTAAAARAVLRTALNDAVRDGYIARNVAQLAQPPRQPRREGRTLTPEQARRLLDHVHGSTVEAPIVLSLALGLRRGELLGLTYADVDLDTGRLTIRHQLRAIGQELELVDTKTAGSVRILNLPNVAATALRSYLADRPGLPAAFLFTTPTGEPIHPSTWTRTVSRTTEAALGERFTPHELRHSAASLMLAAGAPLKAVSSQLGHSSIRVTADVYAHLLADDRTAADALDTALTR